MSDDELLVYIIPEFGSSDFSSSSSSSGSFEFLASAALAALEEDTASSSSAHSRRFIWRDQHSAHERLMSMYFVDEPILRTMSSVRDIVCRRANAAGIRGFSAIQSARARYVAYCNLADNYNEGLLFSTRTARECLDNFCIAIKHLYGEEYLRSPTRHDVARLYEAHEARHHFPSMIGSIDCVAGSNNDINVLKQSPFFIPEVNEKSPEYGFTVNGHRYNRGYYLGDGIYPPWSCFVKAYAYPVARKEKIMKKL
uniref:uncharacterized protein LOC122583173 n=1 Tax=Erigeron canadensis TaxID=72917 RepID=UPI001CB93735|nr:uncharacterized protein LOC122583173 [Erigeron canadensis]